VAGASVQAGPDRHQAAPNLTKGTPPVSSPACQDDGLNTRKSQGGHAKKSVRSTFAGAIPRILRSLPRRAELGEVDVDDLAFLRDLHAVLDQTTAEVIDRLRASDDPPSWGQIGRALGVTRQTAEALYGMKGGARLRAAAAEARRTPRRPYHEEF